MTVESTNPDTIRALERRVFELEHPLHRCRMCGELKRGDCPRCGNR